MTFGMGDQYEGIIKGPVARKKLGEAPRVHVQFDDGDNTDVYTQDCKPVRHTEASLQ